MSEMAEDTSIYAESGQESADSNINIPELPEDINESLDIDLPLEAPPSATSLAPPPSPIQDHMALTPNMAITSLADDIVNLVSLFPIYKMACASNKGHFLKWIKGVFNTTTTLRTLPPAEEQDPEVKYLVERGTSTDLPTAPTSLLPRLGPGDQIHINTSSHLVQDIHPWQVPC